ncbi:hypothetical protein [Sinosporangium siamense]|uniref:Lipoprotein n=1 Tax=Sinosporangium siamense TaxID=1367973 RepID=A0A919RDD7_9ACTN|nr:hypothetical protein [Sinosporangium siamense]GII91828.1 hypothetical protein Ssi02_20590 [Sinosporangium siamense]
MRSARFLVAALALMVASGCTSKPSATEAIAELEQDVRRLESDDLFKSPSMSLRILQRPDKDLPCGENGFKRVLRATANKERGNEDPDSHLDGAQRVMETTLSRHLGYKLEQDISQGDAPEGRFIYGTKETGVVVTVHVASEAPTWHLHAQTVCMPR